MAKIYSKDGDLNLELIDKAGRFTDWMYEQIRPFLTGTILEIGSGRGTYSQKIINDFSGHQIILSDIDAKYVAKLKKRFSSPNLAVLKIDFGHKNDFENLKAPVDSAFALNVLEHVKNDVQALKNVSGKLKPGGKLILLVPAHKFLFNCLDQNVGHYRRYTKKELLEKISQTDFKVKKLFYFNFWSTFAWYLRGNIFKKAILHESTMDFFNKLVPLLRFSENYILRKKLGMSLVVVLEK